MSGKSSQNIPGKDWRSSGLSRSFGITVWISIIVVFVLSFLDLAGWIFNLTIFKSIIPDRTPMKIIAALCFIFAATALVIIRISLPAIITKILTRVFATFICLISLITLYVYLYSFRTGHESSLTGVPYFGFFLLPVMRMAFLTACNFLLIGCILFLLPSENSRASEIAHVLIVPVTFVSYFITVSYMLGVYALKDLNQISVALNSSIAFCGLCAAILMMRLDTWLLRVFTSSRTGGIIARKLLPTLMTLPVVIGWLRINGERAGLFESEEGVILVASAYTVCFLVLIWFTARSVNKIDLKRQASEEALRESEQRLKYHFEHSPLAVVEWKADFIISQWSVEAERIFGWKKEEVIGKRIDALNMIYEEDLPIVENTMKRLSEGKELKVISSNRNYTKNGDVLECTWYNTVLQNEYGQMSSVMSLVEDVTTLKKTLKELIESKEKYKELVTNARSLIINHDVKGKFTFINEFAQNFLGYREEELIGRTALETIMPQTESTGRNLGELAENIYKDPDKYSMNINENIKKNGERVWIEWHNQAMFDRDGARTGYIAIGVDITERKKVEEALKESEEKLWSVLNATKESIYMLDREGIFTLTNATGLIRMEKTSEKELIGHHFSEFMPAELACQRQGKLDKVYRTGDPLEFEDERGGYMFHHNFFPVFKDNEVTSVVTYSADITERKKAENKLKEAKEKLNIALENGNIGVWEWNLKTDEVSLDERMGNMLGLKPGTFGKTYKALENLINEEDISHVQKAISNSLENQVPFETLFRVKSDDKKTKYVSLKALVNKDNDGKPGSITGVGFDVTGMKEGTEQLILKLNEELLRSNKELESFAYVASHDLQEPLRMVSSFTQMLSMRYKDKLDQEAQEFIKFAVDGALRMQTLINDLLEYSRIETRGKTLSVVDMHNILGQVINNLSIKIKEKNAVVTNDELPDVFADGGQMVQLFQNLIGNALKFCNTSPKIHISVKEEQDHHLFTVKDNGIGIEAQYFDRIFQIFQRLHPKDEYGGTGIGLAICKRIVERHGGKIWVESKPGKGAKFSFTIKKR